MLEAIVDTGAMVNVIKSKYIRGEVTKTNIRPKAANHTEI